MNLLARACGLQERILPIISSVSRFVHTVLIQQATFAPLKRWLLMNQPKKSSWSLDGPRDRTGRQGHISTSFTSPLVPVIARSDSDEAI